MASFAGIATLPEMAPHLVRDSYMEFTLEDLTADRIEQAYQDSIDDTLEWMGGGRLGLFSERAAEKHCEILWTAFNDLEEALWGWYSEREIVIHMAKIAEEVEDEIRYQLYEYVYNRLWELEEHQLLRAIEAAHRIL